MRRTLSIAAAAALAALALAACETPAEVSVLGSSAVAVTPGSTFAWAPRPATVTAAPGDPRIDNETVKERLKIAVETALAAKGYREVSDPSQAQLLVAYHVGLQTKRNDKINTTGAGPAPVACDIRGCAGNFGWSAYGAPSAAEARPVDYAEGQLMLDLVDSRSGRLAWRAVSTKRVDGNDATQDGLTAIVVDMTKALPGAAPAHVGG